MLIPVHIESDKRLYIVHPRLKNPHLYLAHFLDASPLMYVRLDGENLSRSAVEEQITQACQEQIASGQLSDVKMLVLDEGDRAQLDVMRELPQWLLFEQGIEKMTLLSRHVPREIFADAALREHLQLLPIAPDKMLYDYTELPNKSEHLLEVNAFGEGQVFLDGEPVYMQEGGVLPRILFYYFIDRRLTTRDDVFELFWPSMEANEATNVFHVTKRKINEMLGVDLTDYTSGFYRVSSDLDVRYDVDLFRQFVQAAAVPDTDTAREKLEIALDLYPNHYLTGLSGINWVKERRSELQELRGEVYSDLAGLALVNEETDEALRLYLQASIDNMAREDIVVHIMDLYLHKEQPCDALHMYNRTRQLLLDTLGVGPGKALRQLADTAQQKCDDKKRKT